jgi:hypothetical protein
MGEAARHARHRVDRQGGQVLPFPVAIDRPHGPGPGGAVLGLLTRAQEVLAREGWAPQGWDRRPGPHSLTDALAVAAFPAGQVDEDQDQEATRAFAMAWREVARTSIEELGVTPRQFEADPSIDRHHVIALLECTKLRLRASATNPQPPNRGSAMLTAIVIPADPAQPCRTERLPAGPDYHRRLQELVAGPLVTATYDPDAYLWVNDVGAAVLPVNQRATTYLREHSAAGRRRPIPPDYQLFGDVVLVGSSAGGDVDVPRRFYQLFGLPAEPTPA